MLRLFLALWLALTPSFAFAGSMTLLGVGKAAGGGGGGGGYAGPGDVATFAYWYGFRGYNAADTSPAANVCLPSGGSCFDITLSSGDAVIPAGLSTCNTTTVQCTVKTMYEKSGSSTCVTAPCNVTNAVQGNQPIFIPSCQNGHPCMQCVSASATALDAATANAATHAQIYSASTVSQRTSNFTTFGAILTIGGVQLAGGAGTTATHWISAGSNVSAAGYTNSAFHAVETVFNGASSTVMIDGTNSTSNPVSPGANAQNTSGVAHLCHDGFGDRFDGYINEAGLANSDITSVRSTLSTQQRTYWGF